MEYKRINMSTKQGLKEGKELIESNWTICGLGSEMVTFSRVINQKNQ